MRWRVGEEFRTAAGALGKVSTRALASVLAAHHSTGPYDLTLRQAPLFAEDATMRLYLFHGSGASFGTAELGELRRTSDGRDVYVYADRVLVDDEDAEDDGIVVHQLPYDLPIVPV